MATETKPFWGKKTYCLITGASQGIGRQIAIDFAQNIADNSSFFLLARNLEKLNETKSLMEAANPKIQVFCHSVNLSEPTGVELHKLITLSLTVFAQDPADYQQAVVVHNAGSLGDVSESAVEMRNVEKLDKYFTLNLYSVTILTAEFLKVFDIDRTKSEIVFINITSLCAVKPFPSMGYYCIGKAAREMYFSVLAEENKDLTVFSYSPGPVYTDMTDEIIANVESDEIKKTFTNMRDESKLLTTQQTVKRLVEILRDRSFTNGGRRDYYDEP